MTKFEKVASGSYVAGPWSVVKANARVWTACYEGFPIGSLNSPTFSCLKDRIIDLEEGGTSRGRTLAEILGSAATNNTQGEEEMATKTPTKKTAAAKTTAKKASTKKPVKKTSTKKTTKPAATKKPAAAKRTDGLRKPQVRILAALAKAPKGLTRPEIAKKAPVDSAMCTEYIGSLDAAKREANDAKHFKSLLSLKFVKSTVIDVDGKDVVYYSITATGKKHAS